jgi:ParB-like chromosome segregation protein Spo0J
MTSRSHHFKDKPFRQLDVPLDKIEVRPGHRAIIQKKADNLAISMREEGLNFPILLSDRLGPESRVLIAGRHRLEAARKLEWLKIPAFVVEMTETEERLREISDNLFRAELTVLERSKQIAEWVRLTGKALSVEEDQPEVLVQVEPKPQGGRPEGGARAAARELGIDRNEVRRADKIDSITEKAQEAAVEAGLDDNQAALLKVASAAPEKQIEVLAGITKKKTEKKTKAKAPKQEKREVSQAHAQGIYDDCDDRDIDSLFMDSTAPIRDKIAEAIKFCLVPSDFKTALELIGDADPTVKGPTLDEVWARAHDPERVAFFDLLRIAPEQRPWWYQPAQIASLPIGAPPKPFHMQRATAALRGLIGEFYDCDNGWNDEERAEGAEEIRNTLALTDEDLEGRIETFIETLIASAPANVSRRRAETRAVAKRKAPVPVEVELDRSAPWKSLPSVEASQATPRHSTLNVKDYLPGLLPGRADPVEPEVADDTPKARADRRRAAKEAQKVAA